jgi:hypothetical protein
MSIDGSFGVNVVFHDRAGSRIKVVQLADHQNYTTGKVAIVTGTVGTTEVNIDIENNLSYKNASGDAVGFSSVTRFAFSASGSLLVGCRSDQNLANASGYENPIVYSKDNSVSIADCLEDEEFLVQVLATAGTASYTLVLYGS